MPPAGGETSACGTFPTRLTPRPTVGNRGGTELKSVKLQALRADGAQRRIFCFYYQHLKFVRFCGAEPPTCVRRHPLAIESETGPHCEDRLIIYILYPIARFVNQLSTTSFRLSYFAIAARRISSSLYLPSAASSESFFAVKMTSIG